MPSHDATPGERDAVRGAISLGDEGQNAWRFEGKARKARRARRTNRYLPYLQYLLYMPYLNLRPLKRPNLPSLLLFFEMLLLGSSLLARFTGIFPDINIPYFCLEPLHHIGHKLDRPKEHAFDF